MAAKEDRDLLFGVMALELGFVTRNDLTAAERARATDAEISLGRALHELRILGTEELALLEALVDKHLQRHGNDPASSLAALRSAWTVAQDPGTPVADRDDSVPIDSHSSIDSGNGIPPTLAGPPDAPDTTGPLPEGAVASNIPRPRRPRYRILRHHASGGLGRVFVAHDEELNREVALKEIHARYAHLADCRSRFLLEAEVTGRLEHPGIVPVYGLGRYADGVPYYAMRLIQGTSLKDAIRTFHETLFSDAGQRTLALRHLLGVFLAVCQAVRYAHSRGVVHRDLKPENIMLGKFGETLVVDWGLAKAVTPSGSESLGEDPTATSGVVPAETFLRPEPDGAPLVTRAGTVLGTPGYMSPEQAGGLAGEVGPASDVYSLGASLYTILTGRAPLTASDLAGALEEGSRGNFPPPRAVDRRVPRALEAVCLKAMALLPRDRYPGARELADDVERWLAYEPVTAYREPPLARIARRLRRHPARVAGLAAAALVGALGLLAVLLVVWSSNRELAASNRRETEARLQADARFREAQGAVNEFFTEISENKELLKKQPGMQALRRKFLEKARNYYEGFLRERGNDPSVRTEAAAAHYRLGEITNSLEPGSPKAVSQYERGVAVLEPLLREGPRDPKVVLQLAELHTGMGTALGRADRFDEGLASHNRARPLLEGLVSDYPGVADYALQLARTYGGIAYIQGRANRSEEAMAANALAAAICEDLVKQHPDVPDHAERLAIIYLNMGADWKAAGNYKEALRSASQSLGVAERLVEKNPGVAPYVQVVVYASNNLGHYQTALGLSDEASSTLTRGTDAAERLARENPGIPDYSNILAYMLYNHGSLQLRRGDAERARAYFDRAVEIARRLMEEYPAVHQYASLGARIYEDLGWAQFATGREESAATAFSRSLAIRERLFREDPKVLEPAASAARLLAECPLVRLRDPARATDLARKCLDGNPNAPEHLTAYGLARYRAGDAREAVASLEKAFKQLPDADESRPSVELALVLARWQAGQQDAARELFNKTVARLDKTGLKHPEFESLRGEAASLMKTDAKPSPAKTGP